MASEILKLDYDTVKADGSDNLTETILELLNSYHGLESTSVDYIEFQVLEENKGIAMFPSSSVAVLTEKEDITDHVTQTCAYSFNLVYRTKSTNKEAVKEWLDNIGRWLEKQEIDGHKIEDYPSLDGNKEFKTIARTSQSYLYGTTDDKAEDWVISLQATYRNEFDR